MISSRPISRVGNDIHLLVISWRVPSVGRLLGSSKVSNPVQFDHTEAEASCSQSKLTCSRHFGKLEGEAGVTVGAEKQLIVFAAGDQTENAMGTVAASIAWAP